MMSTKKVRFNAGRDIPTYITLLPALLLLLVFSYGPMYGIILAFKEYSPYKGILKSDWIGFENFIYFLTDSTFWKVIKNTLTINIYLLILAFPAPIIFALMLNEVRNSVFKRVTQTISYLPYFISWVVVAGIVTSFLSPTSGIVNSVLKNLLGMEPVYFLGEQSLFRTIVVCTFIWKDAGMTSIYYLAAITSIDPGLYEASIIDGANKWRQLWHITLPGIRSIMTVLFLLQVGNLMNIGFEQIFLLYNPLVYDVGDVISTYTYRIGIEQAQYSLTTAIGLTQSVINFIMVYSANKYARKVAGWSLW